MQTDDTMPYFSRKSIVCPLMELNGLCSIQKRLGADLMPEICRRFPRDIRNYGPFAEMHLDPACTRVSEMILENHRAEECDKMLMPFKDIIRLIPAEE